MNGCCDYVEPCHDGDCDGYDEIVRLLPKGALWNPARPGVYGQIIRFLGQWKTCLNQAICQEWCESDPCKARRRFPYFADKYSFPECVDQTNEKLCEWLALISDKECPPGSIGFLKRAIEFVKPGLTVEVNRPEMLAAACCGDAQCATDNPIIISGPPDCFACSIMCFDGIRPAQDGANPCKRYFIPEIECIRDTIFPFGMGVGYLTNPQGPNGEEIFGVVSDPIPEPKTKVITNLGC